MRRIPLVLAAALAVLALLAVLPAGRAVAQDVASVFITNWPEILQVKGDVRITEGTLRQAELAATDPITVPPFISPRDYNRLISGGTLVLDRYPAVVLSLVGQVKGQVSKSGAVGAILLPEVEPVQEAFEQRGEVLFPLEVAVSQVGPSPYFASRQPRYEVAFPRYRVFFYNTSDRTVTVNLYAYLTQ